MSEKAQCREIHKPQPPHSHRMCAGSICDACKQPAAATQTRNAERHWLTAYVPSGACTQSSTQYRLPLAGFPLQWAQPDQREKPRREAVHTAWETSTDTACRWLTIATRSINGKVQHQTSRQNLVLNRSLELGSQRIRSLMTTHCHGGFSERTATSTVAACCEATAAAAATATKVSAHRTLQHESPRFLRP